MSKIETTACGRRGAILAAAALLAGCSAQHTTAGIDAQGSSRLYQLTEAQAVALAQGAMLRAFPGRRVDPIPGPALGFRTQTRSIIDTFDHQVVVTAVQGARADGALVDGYSFDVGGSGTLFAGPSQSADLFRILREDLDRTRTGIEVTGATTRLVAGVSSR